MNYRAGFVGIIGQPNAGKSSLMNVFVKEKVSIVTAKPQTTRRRIVGVLSRPEAQIVFVDSPGFVKASKGLNGFLAQEAKDVIEQSDVLLVVLSVDEKSPEALMDVLDLVKESKKPKVFLIHKTDLGQLEHRIGKIKDLILERYPDAFVTGFSSEKVDPEKVERVFQELLTRLPASPAPLYDVELFTMQSTRDLVAEMVREQCFEELHQEIPYSLAVQIGKYDESDPGLHKIFAEILVAKPNHKAIVIGKGGAVLKKIGTEARKKMEELLGVKVFLSLNVSVKENWQENPRLMKELGYVVQE
jgi:GTP-binding protein Era